VENILKRSLLLIAASISILAGCSALSALMPGMGGGTNVAANTQIGKENNQTGVQVGDVKENKVEAQEIGKLSQAETAIDAANVTINSLPPWVLLLIILGWILPSPMEIYRGLINAITGSISYMFGGIISLVKIIRGKD
jgi:hypothetical protein